MGKLMAVLCAAVVSCQAWAQGDTTSKLDLIAVPTESAVSVGDVFEVPIMVGAQSLPQRYIVSDIVFGWNPAELRFDGISHEGSHPLLWRDFSGLPFCAQGQTSGCGDYNSINEVMPPADGTGLYYGYNILGSVWMVSEPVQVVRLRFTVLAPFEQTTVSILPQAAGIGVHTTVVYGGSIAGLRVTGNLVSATIVGTGLPVGDINGDRVVDSEDLTIMLSAWGASSFGKNPADIDGDGTVGSGDLAILLANWN